MIRSRVTSGHGRARGFQGHLRVYRYGRDLDAPNQGHLRPWGENLVFKRITQNRACIAALTFVDITSQKCILFSYWWKACMVLIGGILCYVNYDAKVLVCVWSVANFFVYQYSSAI